MPRVGRPRRPETPHVDRDDLVALITRIADGDRAALGALYDATSTGVFSLARRILRETAAAEDVTMEVYLQVYSHAAGYDPARGAPRAWLMTLARSRAIDRLRADTVRAEREDPVDVIASVAADADPEEAVGAAERRRIARAALAALAPEQRELIEIAYFTGRSHGEIASRLGIPIGTVKTRIRAGMARLRSLLAPRGVEET
jgi:RNA polymerase sigma-70 factor, ECF subfamily